MSKVVSLPNHVCQADTAGEPVATRLPRYRMQQSFHVMAFTPGAGYLMWEGANLAKAYGSHESQGSAVADGDRTESKLSTPSCHTWCKLQN